MQKPDAMKKSLTRRGNLKGWQLYLEGSLEGGKCYGMWMESIGVKLFRAF